MALNFPIAPTIGQTHVHSGKYFRWDGVVWKQLNTTKERQITEYTNFYNVPVSNSVTLDARKYNYFKVEVSENTTITVPAAQPFSKFMLELGLDNIASSWNLAAASYDNASFLVSGQDTDPFNIFFKPDGTKMYMLGTINDRVYQYTLSTAWSISTATYDNVSFLVSGQDTNPDGVFFHPDGTKMYMVGRSNARVYQYTLSTPWNLSTASYDNISFFVGGQDSFPFDVFFKPDGTKMYMVGRGNRVVYQYTLSTAWNVSTASYDNVSFLFTSQDTAPRDIFFKPDGTKMYMIGFINKTVYQYTLSTPWSLATASYDNVSFLVSGQDIDPYGIFFHPDGTKMYMVGDTNARVFQYDLSTTFPTITWSDLPNTPLTLNFATSLFEVTSYDGRTWVPVLLSEI